MSNKPKCAKRAKDNSAKPRLKVERVRGFKGIPVAMSERTTVGKRESIKL